MNGKKIRIMPDVHSNGNGTVTGFSMSGGEPEIMMLEFDAGCGVSCARVESGGSPLDFARLDNICHEIPASKGERLFEPAYEYDFSPLYCYEHIRSVLEWPLCLGSLGGGNHFIELDRDEEENLYLVVHNGLGPLSGPAVRYYQRLALKHSGKTPAEARMEDLLLYGRERQAYHERNACQKLSDHAGNR